VKKGFVPLMDHRRAFICIAARTHGQDDAFMVERNGRLRFPMDDGHQVPPPPEIVTLPLDELARCFPRLTLQLVLLLPNPMRVPLGAASVTRLFGG
jgi:uracil-DNA glycosylase